MISQKTAEDVVLKTLIDMLMNKSVGVCQEAGNIAGLEIAPTIVLLVGKEGGEENGERVIMMSDVKLRVLHNTFSNIVKQLEAKLADNQRRIDEGEEPCPRCGEFHAEGDTHIDVGQKQ